MFYEKQEQYTKLKNRQSVICTVCGARKYKPENPDDVYDALEFKHLLGVDEKTVALYEGMKLSEDDEIGILAQKCFHIEYVKQDKKYYHFLDFDESKSSNNSKSKEIQQRGWSGIH